MHIQAELRREHISCQKGFGYALWRCSNIPISAKGTASAFFLIEHSYDFIILEVPGKMQAIWSDYMGTCHRLAGNIGCFPQCEIHQQIHGGKTWNMQFRIVCLQGANRRIYHPCGLHRAAKAVCRRG